MKYKYKDLSIEEVKEIVKRNKRCILSMCKKNNPYILPLYYEINNDSEEMTLEICTSSIGKKIDYLKNNDRVSILIMKKRIKKDISIVLEGKVYIENENELSKIRVCQIKYSGRIYG